MPPPNFYKDRIFKDSWHQAEVGGSPRLKLLPLIAAQFSKRFTGSYGGFSPYRNEKIQVPRLFLCCVGPEHVAPMAPGDNFYARCPWGKKSEPRSPSSNIYVPGPLVVKWTLGVKWTLVRHVLK